MSGSSASAAQAARSRRWWPVPLLLALVVLAAHGPALRFGLFMDDYAHLEQLQEAGWSLGDLVAACRLELVGGVVELWWLPECTLRFFRPVAFALMKAVYELSGWSPLAAHAASLGWHWLVCCLLYALLRRCGLRGVAAGWAAVLFALHPGHTATVQWIASQSELMVTSFALAATLAWLRWRATGGAGSACVALVCFALALGCRENAIVLPAILVAAELAGWRSGAAPGQRGRAGPVTRWALLAAAVVVAGGYLGLRAWLLGGVSVPPRPYVVPPAAADFLPYVLNKALYYLLAEFWLVPAVPIGGLAYFSGVPLVFYGFSLLTVVAVGVWVWRRRQELAVRLGVCWLLLAMAPVLPVFESPHHLYLPGVGWALLIASVLDRLAAIDPRRLRARLGGAAVVTAALLFALLTHFNSLAMEAADRLEDAVVADVIADAPDLRDGDTLYVANLPIIAHYVGLAVEQRTGVRDLRCVALTWAPRVLGVRTASECRRIDAHTLEFTLADDRYFSGPFGTLVAQANHGRHAAALLATPCARDGYRIELVAGDAAGIRALRVHFDRPWGAGRRLFYWGSAARWATRLEAADGE